MSVSPRCTVHGISVTEYIPMIQYARGVYRAEFADRPGSEELVANALMKLLEHVGVNCACGRNMILNADDREHFLARRDAYPTD
jgi:hypothetical protein